MKAFQTIENEIPEPRLSAKAMKEFIKFLGEKYQYDVLNKLRRGPLNRHDFYGDLTLEMDVDEACIDIEACLNADIEESLIEDIVRKGFANHYDDGTLTGLGPYAEVPLTENEEELLAELRNSSGGTGTVMGLKRKFKFIRIKCDPIQEMVQSLVAKGYVEAVDKTEAGSTVYRAL